MAEERQVTREQLNSWYTPKLSAEEERQLGYEKLQEEADQSDRSEINNFDEE